MMRQSPKPYAKGKVRRTPPRPRFQKYCPAVMDLSTDSCVVYRKIDPSLAHLWGFDSASHPFVQAKAAGFNANPPTQSLRHTGCRARRP